MLMPAPCCAALPVFPHAQVQQNVRKALSSIALLVSAACFAIDIEAIMPVHVIL